MFRLKFRIVDDIMELSSVDISHFDIEIKHITGFFQMQFGEHIEGHYYHEGPLGEGEVGGELLDYWFAQLAKGMNLLERGGNYFAIKEIETMDRWIEVQQYGKNLIINVAIDNEHIINQLFLSENPGSFVYENPRNFTLSWEEMKSCLIATIKSFLLNLQRINPKLINTQMALILYRQLEQLE